MWSEAIERPSINLPGLTIYGDERPQTLDEMGPDPSHPIQLIDRRIRPSRNDQPGERWTDAG